MFIPIADITWVGTFPSSLLIAVRRGSRGITTPRFLHSLTPYPREACRSSLQVVKMPRQQSSIMSNNWRQPQGTPANEINKLGQTFKSLNVSQPRRDRGNTFISKMPTIDEDNSFTTVKSRRMREAPVEIHEQAFAIQSPAAMYGAGKPGASSAESRIFSNKTSAQGSLKHASMA